MMLGQLDIHRPKKKKILGTDFTPFTKINFKWNIDLNIKRETIKLLKDNMGEKSK